MKKLEFLIGYWYNIILLFGLILLLVFFIWQLHGAIQHKNKSEKISRVVSIVADDFGIGSPVYSAVDSVDEEDQQIITVYNGNRYNGHVTVITSPYNDYVVLENTLTEASQ